MADLFFASGADAPSFPLSLLQKQLPATYVQIKKKLDDGRLLTTDNASATNGAVAYVDPHIDKPVSGFRFPVGATSVNGAS